MSARPAEHPAADVLRVLAVSHSSGALEIRGTPGGTIYLHDGAITFAEAPGAPELPKPGAASRQDLAEAVQASVLEAGLILLTGPGTADDKPLFRPGRQHWTGITCRLDVDRVLDEIARQRRRFTDLGVDPDAEVRLRPLPRSGSVMFTADQWRLVSHAPGPVPVRALAALAGMPLTRAVAALAELRPSGVVDVTPAAGVPVAPPPVRPAPPPPTAPVAAHPPAPPTPSAGTRRPAAPALGPGVAAAERPRPEPAAAPAQEPATPAASNVVPLRAVNRTRATAGQRPREAADRAEPGGATAVTASRLPTRPGRERPAATPVRLPERAAPAERPARTGTGGTGDADALPVLPRRSPGAARVPAAAGGEPPRESRDGRTALALRLLEGLRRM